VKKTRRNSSTPASRWYSSVAGFEADSVSADNVKVGRLATEHLIRRGHKRIAIITGQLSLRVSQDRVDGWKRAMKRHKLRVFPAWLREGDWTEDSGYHLMFELLELDRPQALPPTGVMCPNFQVMAGVLRALQGAGCAMPG
jgi:DNA-binding LacI/PurR family transcriptional regulator